VCSPQQRREARRHPRSALTHAAGGRRSFTYGERDVGRRGDGGRTRRAARLGLPTTPKYAESYVLGHTGGAKEACADRSKEPTSPVEHYGARNLPFADGSVRSCRVRFDLTHAESDSPPRRRGERVADSEASFLGAVCGDLDSPRSLLLPLRLSGAALPEGRGPFGGSAVGASLPPFCIQPY